MLNNRQLETLYWAGKLSSSPRQRRSLTPRKPPFLCAFASSRAHWGRLFSPGVTARLASPRRAASFGYAEQIRVSEGRDTAAILPIGYAEVVSIT
jgi:hypothetical protein